MNKVTVEDIIAKYTEGKASVAEINQLDNWYDSFDSQPDLYLAGTPELKQALAEKFSELKVKLLIDQAV
jgi:hypothetical protein